MGVQLAGELDPAAEAERLAQWAASYRVSGGMGGWLAPRRETGEQWQAVIRTEAVFAAQRDRLDERPRELPGRLAVLVRQAQDALVGGE